VISETKKPHHPDVGLSDLLKMMGLLLSVTCLPVGVIIKMRWNDALFHLSVLSRLCG
jgi:hypothetical protein